MFIKKTIIFVFIIGFIILSKGDAEEKTAYWLEGIHRIENIAQPTEIEEMHSPRIVLPPGIRAGETFFVRVRVGDMPHPMTDEHFILHVEWLLDGVYQGRISLNSSVPRAEFEIPLRITKEAELRILSRCNVHGLWENSVTIMPLK